MQGTNSSIKLLITIIDRGKGEKVVRLCKSAGPSVSIISLGRGTAPTTLLDYLGLGETEKDIVFTIAGNDTITAVMPRLEEDLALSKPGHGVAFAIPVESLGGIRVFDFLTSSSAKEKEA